MAGFLVSKAAYNDIRSIAVYTQKTWGVARRRRYLSGLNDKFVTLADMPEMAPERCEFVPPVRIFPYEKHLIVYVHENAGILILRVLHRNMDIDAQLSG